MWEQDAVKGCKFCRLLSVILFDFFISFYSTWSRCIFSEIINGTVIDLMQIRVYYNQCFELWQFFGGGFKRNVRMLLRFFLL